MLAYKSLCLALFLTLLLNPGYSLAQSADAKSTPLTGFHIVLVGGLANETVPAYFEKLKEFLRENGAGKITTIMPSSTNTVTQNAEPTRDALLNAHSSTPDLPLLIIAHSKGGLETLNSIARHYGDFPASVVHKIIFANVPFKGSPYMPVALEEFKNQWGWGLNLFNPVYLNAVTVLESLLIENIQADLKESFRTLSEEQIRELSSRVSYFRSEIDRTQLSGDLRKAADYLAAHGHAKNDGLIPTENQKLDELKGLQPFGQDLGVLEKASHRDIFEEAKPSDVQTAGFEKLLQAMTEKLNSKSCDRDLKD